MSDKLVPPLTKKDVKELQTLFDEYDDDGSGELELEELTTMMRSLGKYRICTVHNASSQCCAIYTSRLQRNSNFWITLRCTRSEQRLHPITDIYPVVQSYSSVDMQ